MKGASVPSTDVSTESPDPWRARMPPGLALIQDLATAITADRTRGDLTTMRTQILKRATGLTGVLLLSTAALLSAAAGVSTTAVPLALPPIIKG
jgi:hypothetical protein